MNANQGRTDVVYLSMGSPHREYSGVAAALAERGVRAHLVHLDDVDAVDWSGVGLVNVRMCRGYHTDPDFLARLERLHDVLRELPQGPIPLANSLPLLRGAVDKGRYLRLLADKAGIGLIPTRWLPRGTDLRIAELLDDTGWDDVVIKPTVSAGSWRTVRISRTGRSTSDSHFILEASRGGTPPYEEQLRQLLTTHDLFAQRFLPSVLDQGELSLVFLGGQFSHAVRKTVGQDGGWWAHERFGGINHRVQPTDEEYAWGAEIHRALERHYGRLWFGRIDGIRDENGDLRLLECELAIPRLLLPEGNAFGRYADVITSALRDPAGDLGQQPVLS
ncbi:hypothetical protein SAMN04487983_102060 [Streptomyces sp. yr375]|uniref:ATP-grasp domain-containing protein n=1 Tax=Streptomyces sp. yr375 TaxID=1761906 RepID=UPI0008B4FB58|nr:hypothetical protein [Streptomyces sp. yr375]SER68066.1 hypothetical protein SAMN04487983_102060 [Streptomyces sp. yr375]